MDRAKLLVLLDELFELPAGTLKGPERLQDLERWDSLGAMSFIALAADNFGVALSPRQFGPCETINDLIALTGVEKGEAANSLNA